jgi:hypothetical protein
MNSKGILILSAVLSFGIAFVNFRNEAINLQKVLKK